MLKQRRQERNLKAKLGMYLSLKFINEHPKILAKILRRPVMQNPLQKLLKPLIQQWKLKAPEVLLSQQWILKLQRFRSLRKHLAKGLLHRRKTWQVLQKLLVSITMMMMRMRILSWSPPRLQRDL